MISTSDAGNVSLPQLRGGGSVLRSTVTHAVAAALLWITPVVSLLVPATFISAGLRNGWKGLAGSIAGSVTLLAALLVPATAAADRMEVVAQIALLAAQFGGGAAMATYLIRRGTSCGPTLLAAVGASAAGFVVAEVLFRGVANHSLYTAVIEEFKSTSLLMIDTWRSRGAAEEMLRAMKQATDTLAGSYVPAMLLVEIAVSMALSLAAIPRLPAGLGFGERYLFRTIRYPEWMLVLFVVAGLSPLASGTLKTVGVNLLAAVMFLYLLQGLAIFRALLANMHLGLIGVSIAFLLLVFMSQYFIAPALLFLAGLFDPFFDFRNIHRKDDSNESDLD